MKKIIPLAICSILLLGTFMFIGFGDEENTTINIEKIYPKSFGIYVLDYNNGEYKIIESKILNGGLNQ